MIINMSMSRETDKFEVQTWWATSPDFVLEAMVKQLHAATTIWPELSAYRLRRTKRESEPTQDQKVNPPLKNHGAP